jgi:hypothetical protein
MGVEWEMEDDMQTMTLTVSDDSKMDILLSMLRKLAYVRVSFPQSKKADPVAEINAAIAGIDTRLPDDLMAAQMEVIGDEDW